MHIRQARETDVSRIAEIYVFNNRVNFYPIFRNEEYSFGELQVVSIANEYLTDREAVSNTFVYDDGVVRGFIRVEQGEIRKLFVDPFFQGRGIGTELIKFAVQTLDGKWLWALEKNVRAIRFYQRQRFSLTGDKRLEEGTDEYLVKLKYSSENSVLEWR